MNLVSLNKKFNTKNRCYKLLEKVRWGKKPICPHCQSESITPRLARKYYYHCNGCNSDFTVLFGTIFEDSKLPLPKWFLLIAMMLNARKGISAKQLERQLGVTYKTAWYSAMRVRCAMIDEAPLLEGIVEMDEVFIGGKPRKGNSPYNEANLSRITSKRGRGTNKVPVVGIVERGGEKRVVTEISTRLTTKGMLALLHKYVSEERSIIMTDEAAHYKKFDDIMQHLVINHSERYVDGDIHTNTIEGYWAIIKNGIRGEYHVLSRKYLPFYLAEFAYKYNRRFKQKEAFDETIGNAVGDEKCLVNYKPKPKPKNIKRSSPPGKSPPSEYTSNSFREIIERANKSTQRRNEFKLKKKKIRIEKERTKVMNKVMEAAREATVRNKYNEKRRNARKAKKYKIDEILNPKYPTPAIIAARKIKRLKVKEKLKPKYSTPAITAASKIALKSNAKKVKEALLIAKQFSTP